MVECARNSNMVLRFAGVLLLCAFAAMLGPEAIKIKRHLAQRVGEQRIAVKVNSGFSCEQNV